MKRFKKGLASLVAATVIIGTITTVSFAAEESSAKKSSSQTLDGIVVSDVTTETINGKVVVNVEMLTQGKKAQLKTQAVDSSKVDVVKANLSKGNLVDYKTAANGEVVVPSDAAKTFNKILSKGSTNTVQFDSMKYGAELSPNNDAAGNMVAAGWVYGKTNTTITIGDGKVVTTDISGRALKQASKPYEETYKIDKDVKVYNVNTEDYSISKVSDFASVPVTTDHNYTTTSRQAAYVVFDKNYKGASSAKVTEIYYFTPKSTSDGKPVWDVPEQSFLLKGKGTEAISGLTFDKVVQDKPNVSPYTRSSEPFEIVKDTFYYVGDNEVAVYLFKADMGTKDKSDDRLIVFDAGWPNSGYQYWKNIEAVGYDPRKVTDIMLTHGHLDHYGTAVELINMIENAGGKVKLWGSKEDTLGITEDALGNKWDIKGALPDTEAEAEIRKRTVAYEYDKYMDFGNVQILATPTPGHTPGTASFVFKTKNSKTNKWVSFGYHGGYGFNGLEKPNATNGYLRLNYQLGLAWLQQMVDVDYVAPQHTNQYPIVEVYQALKAYNNDPANKRKQLTMLDALTKNEFINFAEKRYSVATNKASDGQYDGKYQSIETYGPFKTGRENGVTGVKATLKDGGKIIQGFNKAQNVNAAIPLLKDGVVIEKDSYVNDPNGWYVQFYVDVLDDYPGYLPGGPIESLHAVKGAPEVLRTQRLNSKEEAEAILKTVKAGGTYSIDLTKASAIVVPEKVTDTFKEVK